MKDWICEECGEPIIRNGNSLYCPNGCFEDDIRNGYSEDYIEQYGIPWEEYPIDENVVDIQTLRQEAKEWSESEINYLDWRKKNGNL